MMAEMRRCYIAASISQRDDVRLWAMQLRQYGIDCQMRWLNHYWPFEGNHTTPANRDAAQTFAIHDLEDAARASLLICVTGKDGAHWGRLVELGVGLASADEVWVVDDLTNPRNIFCTLSTWLPDLRGDAGCSGPIVRRFASMTEAIEFARREVMGHRSQPQGV